MKRPLCAVCVAFVAAVFVSLKIGPPVTEQAAPSGDMTAVYIGEVCQREYKGDKLVIYLKNVKVQSGISDYDVFSANSAREISGIICYMKNPLSGESVKQGATVAVQGSAAYFDVPRNYGEFNARLYYKTLGYDLAVYSAEILAQSSTYSPYKEMLCQIKLRLEGALDCALDEEDAAAMKAILLGSKSQLSAGAKELYRQSGIYHIFAISGLHITIIGMSLYRILRRIRLPAALAAAVSVSVMFSYGVMTGMSASAVRAVIMFALKLLADFFNRSYDMLTALALAAILMLMEQPLYILHTGFLLSFSAIIGICIFSNTVLVHFPIFLCTYYEFPIYSYLINLIVIPIMPALMCSGLLCMACALPPAGGIWGLLASFFGAVCHIILKAFELISAFSLKLPFAQWITGRPENWRIVCYYAVLLFLAITGKRLGSALKLPLITAAIVLLSAGAAGELKISFLDVGQGDCIWIETPDDRHYMIDAGSSSESGISQYTLTPFLKYTGTSKIDAVFITHLDSDHTSGIIGLLEEDEGIEIGQIVLAEAAIRDEAYYELEGLCGANDVLLRTAKAGDIYALGEDISLEVLHPSADYETQSRNAYSLIMRLEYKDFSALFTGDAEADGEAAAAEYLAQAGKGADIYKVTHHGSKYSNTQVLLEAVMPKLAVISCAEDNSYGHPHDEVIEALKSIGSEILITKDTGEITVTVRNNQAEVSVFYNSEQ